MFIGPAERWHVAGFKSKPKHLISVNKTIFCDIMTALFSQIVCTCEIESQVCCETKTQLPGYYANELAAEEQLCL